MSDSNRFRDKPGPMGSAFPEPVGKKAPSKNGWATFEEGRELATALLNARAYSGEELTVEHWMWNKFLNHADPRIALEAFKFINLFKYGKPAEKKEITVKGHAYVAEIPPKFEQDEWRKRYEPKELKKADKDGNG